jgi:hypothetical protein
MGSRVGLYARVSTVHGQDPEVQLLELREYCQRRGLEIAEEFVDKGISGSRERRPALDKLMVACRKTLLDCSLSIRQIREKPSAVGQRTRRVQCPGHRLHFHPRRRGHEHAERTPCIRHFRQHRGIRTRTDLRPSAFRVGGGED